MMTWLTALPEESRIVMMDRSLPEPASVAWQDKPIDLGDARKGRQPGLAAFLDRVRQRPYVTSIRTEQHLQGLVAVTDFAPVSGEPACLEGWFAAFQEESTTRFTVTTTARTPSEQLAVLRDLRQVLLGR